MKELICNVWKFAKSPNVIICITTNGFLKKNGECVMGRGIAYQATQRYKDIQKTLGYGISKNGNVFQHLLENIYAFPVKHNWYEMADINLIIESSKSLAELAKEHPGNYYLLPRPGCDNGRLEWSFVKPYIKDILPDNVIVVTNKKDSNIEDFL